jgi:hypothetical protein
VKKEERRRIKRIKIKSGKKKPVENKKRPQEVIED